MASTLSFQQQIYQNLDEKLRSMDWHSGASEAHGILCGLVCRGINEQEIGNKLYLFQSADTVQRQVLEGMFSLIMRDLSSPEFGFHLMLPDDKQALDQRAEEMTNWCQGFLQGLLHDGESVIKNGGNVISEVVDDILQISHIDINNNFSTEYENERYLVEIEEHLRVSVQLVYDELNTSQVDC